MLRRSFVIIFIGITFFIAPAWLFAATTTISQDAQGSLQTKIKDKSEELQQINEQIASTTKALNVTRQERTSLQQELNKLDSNVKQLNLNIKANQITIEKLSLEIESLGYDLRDIEDSMEVKKDAVGEILRLLQQKNSSNFLVTFLKTNTLSDLIGEAESYYDLQNKLIEDISNLKVLHEQYNKTLNDISSRKTNVSVKQQTLENQKVIVQDQQKDRQVLLTQTRNKESVYQQQVAELKKRQEEIASEIEEIGNQLRKNINPNLLPPSQPGILAWPVNGGRMSQGYGATAFARTAYQGQFHNGVDIAAPIGTEIYASENGVVINAGNQDSFCPRGAYGRFVVIKHTNGLTTLSAHLSRYVVSIGQTVKRGQVIGYVGQSGYATGPHLHFTVFATQTLPPAIGNNPEGTKASRSCGPMPVGGDINPTQYLSQA